MRFFLLLLRVVSFIPFLLIASIISVLIFQTFKHIETAYYIREFFQNLLFNSMLNSILITLIAFPIGVLISFYLYYQGKTRVSTTFYTLNKMLSVTPSIIFAAIGVMFFIPLLEYFHLVSYYIILIITFSFMLIPFIVLKLHFFVQKKIDPMLKEVSSSLGFSPLQTFIYLFIPLLRFELITIFLWSISIVIGESIIFIFVSHYTNSSHQTISEYIALSLIDNSESFSQLYIMAFFLFVMINIIDVIRYIIWKKYE
ncbi:ABC transporter permease subunit [bacterium]|nr:ABC transporter permease subunit [bacterium]